MSYFRLWTTDRPSRERACIGACFVSLSLLAALLVAATAESPIVVVRSNRVLAVFGEAEHAAASDVTAVRASPPDEVLGDSIIAGSPRTVAARDRQNNGPVIAPALDLAATSKPLSASRQDSAASSVPVAAQAPSRLSSFTPTLPVEPIVWPTSTSVPPPPTPIPPAPTAAPTAVPPAPTAVPPVVTAAPVAVAPPVVVAPPPVVPTQVAVVPAAIPRSGPTGVINQIPGSAWRWLDASGWSVDWRQGPGPGRVAEAQYSTSTIVIWYDTRRSDTTWAGAFAHELGHAVSYMHFGTQQMTDWNSMRGLSSWRWVPGTANDFGVGEGDFAEAFMSYLLGHPVRSVGGALSQQHRAWIAANTPF